MARSQNRQLPAVIAPRDPGRVTAAILDFVSEVPESQIGGSEDPAGAARRLAKRAARRAALTAGSLALPPGPLAWPTMLPEMIGIWKIQAQLVSDIAAAHGRHAMLGREQMMWCLFRHTAAQAFRDLVVRLGDRLIFQRMSQAVLRRLAGQIGLHVGRRAAGQSFSRWVPAVGAVGVGAYAYYDTMHVAETTLELFSSEMAVEDAPGIVPTPDADAQA